MYSGYRHGGQVDPTQMRTLPGELPSGGMRGIPGLISYLRRKISQLRDPDYLSPRDSAMQARMDEAADDRQAAGDFQEFLRSMGGGRNLFPADDFGIRRPRPPLYTAENANLLNEMYTDHEMDALGILRGNASGGLIGLSNGGMAPSETTVEASTVNPAIAQQTANLTDKIVQEGDRPYQQYDQNRIAGFTKPEAIAQQGIINYGMSGGPQGTQQAAGTMGQAGQMMSGAAQGIGGLMPAYGAMSGQFGGQAAGALGQAQQDAQGMSTLGATMGSPAQQSSTDLSNYMSQYTKGVVDPQLAQLAEFQKMQGEELGAQAAATGNLGGMREGVQGAQIARDTSRQAADVIGQAQQDAFVSAQQAFQGDRNAQMAGQQQQLEAQKAAGALGQTGYGTMGALMGQQMGALGAQQGALQQMGALGSQMGGLGTRQAQLGQQQQAQQLQRLNAMQGAGAQQRALQQQSLNMGYQDWQNQQNQNRQNINWQLGAMGQLPYQNIQARTTYTGQPSGLNALAGAGLQGLTLYNQMQNGGNTGQE